MIYIHRDTVFHVFEWGVTYGFGVSRWNRYARAPRGRSPAPRREIDILRHPEYNRCAGTVRTHTICTGTSEPPLRSICMSIPSLNFKFPLPPIALGQTWQTRGGGMVRVDSRTINAAWPWFVILISKPIEAQSTTWFVDERGHECGPTAPSPYDLVMLLQDATAPDPVPPQLHYTVGDVWRTRGGHTVRIVSRNLRADAPFPLKVEATPPLQGGLLSWSVDELGCYIEPREESPLDLIERVQSPAAPNPGVQPLQESDPVDLNDPVGYDDPVDHPAHYTMGAIEVIDAIEDWQLNYHRGQVIKYVSRAGRKDPRKEIEDLQKARWYLDREISRLSSEATK